MAHVVFIVTSSHKARCRNVKNSMLVHVYTMQWSNYQKISKGAHIIVNANEAMLLTTGGSRTSESGDKFFPKFFYDFLRAFLKIFFLFIYSPKISDDNVLRKIHHCTFGRKISERPFLGILPQNLQFLSVENSDDLFFLVITKFLPHKFLYDLFTILPKLHFFSLHPYFHILHMMNHIPIFCTLYIPYIRTHMLFSCFCILLCALVTVHTAYTIYFVLIHHCTNSLSSLHIFVHHCTFCASLHTKTNPALLHELSESVAVFLATL